MSYRKTYIDITWWSFSGIKVPNSAIKSDENDLKYVIKKTGNGTKKALIKVLKKNDDYSIIGNYSSDDLKKLGINTSEYTNIDMYDTVIFSSD